jgi:hypothetical protein
MLALGTAVEARLCTGPGALPLVSRGNAADYYRHTQGEMIRTILRHLQLAVDPPAMALARVRQEAFAWPLA